MGMRLMVACITPRACRRCVAGWLTSDLSHGDPSVLGSHQVHMVRADAGSQCQLELVGLLDALTSEVAWVEGPALSQDLKTPMGLEAYNHLSLRAGVLPCLSLCLFMTGNVRIPMQPKSGTNLPTWRVPNLLGHTPDVITCHAVLAYIHAPHR
jgi:hypothetical protein